MSDPSTPRPAYDPNELRRCITLCFSPTDLRTLAESLGATDLHSWDRGIQEAARDVIRHFEKLGTVDQLVAKLAEARPLMEWPAPLHGSTATNPSPFAPPEPPAPPAITTTTTAPTTETPAKPAEPPAAAPVPVIRDPFAPAWPGTTVSPSFNEKQRDGRKITLLFGIGFVVVTTVAIGLFLAVRVGKSSETPASTEMHAGRPLRPNGPARMAAEAMKRSFESLARGCDLQMEPGAEVGPWLFAAAYAQCGSRARIPFAPTDIRQNKPIASDPAAAPVNDAPDPIVTPRQTPAGRDTLPRLPAAPPTKTAPLDTSSGCLDKCAAAKQQCSRACGTEPTSGAQYDRWQSCQTQCLSTASKCRLACQ